MIAALWDVTTTHYGFYFEGRVLSVPRDRPTYQQIVRGDIPVSDLDFDNTDIDAVFSRHGTFCKLLDAAS